MSSYIFDSVVMVMYTSPTSTKEVVSTIATLASFSVLCFCSKNAGKPKSSSIFEPPHLSSLWCFVVIETSSSHSQFDSILIVSQLKLPRGNSSSS
ncbi:hypothetical protein F2Q69_00056422 [Brassica cretica]|uniref:Uncharacterized protein n=1 Tax=Brassica cretica TaxID=69181 RepID=A0A8S9N7D4_BRACR|nr:hypothetical protein F2Q69_00056422 [Brassica cretica]